MISPDKFFTFNCNNICAPNSYFGLIITVVCGMNCMGFCIMYALGTISATISSGYASAISYSKITALLSVKLKVGSIVTKIGLLLSSVTAFPVASSSGSCLVSSLISSKTIETPHSASAKLKKF